MSEKNSDGTYKHFEMKGGTYAGFLRDLNEISCRLSGCVSSFHDMSREEINGTTVALCVFSYLEKAIDRLTSEMQKARNDFIK